MMDLNSSAKYDIVMGDMEGDIQIARISCRTRKHSHSVSAAGTRSPINSGRNRPSVQHCEAINEIKN